MNRFLSAVILFAAALLSMPAAAQVVLTGGEIHVGDGDVIENGSVVIAADGRIGAVGENVAVPQNAKVVDVSGKVVTPGLIDVSTSLGLTEIWAVTRTRDVDPGRLDHDRDHIRAAFRAADAFNPMSVAIPVTRVNGVTSVVTLPGGGLISGQGAFVDLQGEVGHATVVQPYAVLKATLGERGGREVGGSRGGAVLLLRETLEDAKYWADNESDFDSNRTRNLSASRLDMAALQPVLAGDRPLFLRVDKASDILAALALSREYGLKPVIIGGAEAWMVADELARENVPVVVQPTKNMPWSFDMLGARQDNAALLVEAGVATVLSTFDAHNVRNLRYEAGNAVRAGLPHRDALTAVTKTAAEAAGLGDSHGTVQAGKVANVVVWSGDPFEISTTVEKMWIGGEEIELVSRQSELFQRYRTLDRRAPPAAPLNPSDGDDGSRASEESEHVESID